MDTAQYYRNEELLARLLYANIKEGNYEGDDPIIKEHPELQLSFVARKTLFLIGYKHGWEWVQQRKDSFYKDIDFDVEISEEAKKSAPKNGNGVVTWEIGFCAGVTSYLNEYIKEKETTI